MARLYRLIFTGFLFITTFCLHAQQFGGTPPRTKWKQVNIPEARIIFPEGLDSIARQVAGTVQHLNTTTQSSIGNLQGKVSIVLQNHTTISNGYVALGPYRSEFYLTPQQNSFNLGSLPWHVHLSLHEFRHVQQNNNFNVGLSKAFRILFGELGQAFANSAFVPDWFYEGDAVFNETGLSGQGRGRLPAFFNGYRSLYTAGKAYSWMKLRNGSLRDYTPDHYQLGYLLVSYGREQYGDDFWKKVTHDAAAGKGLIYPFQKAVRKYSGKSYSTFRNEALNYFKDATGAENKPQQTATGSSKHFDADEEFSAFLDDSAIVFVKNSYREIPAFVIRDRGRERRLRVRDVSLDNQFAYSNGKIVYSSYRPHIRWGWQDYSDIRILNTRTGRQQSVTKRSKYFSPDINDKGTVITAVQVSPGGRAELHLLDAKRGSILAKVPNQHNLFYTYPRLYNTDKVISAVRNPAGQMSLALIDASTGNNEYLLPFSFNVIGFPFIHNDTIFFSASRLGYDRILAYTLEGKKLYQLNHPALNTVTGNYQPAIINNSIMWSHFTDTGFQVQRLPMDVMRWTTISPAEFATPPPGFAVESINRSNPAIFSAYGDLPVTRYPKSYRLFNFHSLQPLTSDPVYSLSLIGENVLNTLQSELFFRYNRNEQYKQLGFNGIYGALFPFISAGLNYTIDRRALYRNRRVYWNELELRGGMSVPLNFSKGRNYTGLTAGSDYVFNKSQFKGLFKDSFDDRSFSYISSTISFYNQVQKSRQQIYPRFAQTLLVNFRNSISSITAKQFLASGYLYLPGIALTHNLVLNGAFQEKDTMSQRNFSNSFPFSRGYSSENFTRMFKFGANYHFPLVYPDAGIGNIAYLLRLRANLFYDYTFVKDARSNTAPFSSVGTELFADTKWWNQLPVSVGLRYSYLLNRDLYGGSGKHRFELILPVNLIQR